VLWKELLRFLFLFSGESLGTRAVLALPHEGGDHMGPAGSDLQMRCCHPCTQGNLNNSSLLLHDIFQSIVKVEYQVC
jgi:hypothetical protein